MRPHSNSLAQCSLYCSVLLLAAALAFSAMMLLSPTLPVQAQSESTDNDTGDTPAQSESTDNDTGDPQPTGKHLIVFSATNTLPTDSEQRIADLGGTVQNQYEQIGVMVASGLSEEAAKSLEAFEDVEAVEEDVERQWLDPQEQEASAEASVEEHASMEVEPASVAVPSSAQVYSSQWHLGAIGADKAWKASPSRLGSSEVTVAILDTGIGEFRRTAAGGEVAHPDLRKLRLQDVRGKVDRDRSVSFVESDDAIVDQNFPGTPHWTDLHIHGTHVAATVSSNAVGAAGVTSKVNLMAVKVLNRNGSGSTEDVLAGINYAADRGADVMNMSLSGNFNKSAKPGEVEAINRAINYANRKGSTIVVAAGNDTYNMDSDSDRYQAYCQSPHVVCVSATGPTNSSLVAPWENIDSQAPYSNFGSPITVAAPGGNASPVWAACSKTSMLVVRNEQNVIVNDYRPCRTIDRVIGLKGTSMAAPHVSGLAALLVERIGKKQPSQVAAQIRKSAVDLGEPDKDVVYGHGRIDVAKALNLPPPTP